MSDLLDLNVLFVIPLAIGLAAAYIASKARDDLAYLAIAIAIVSSMVCLIIAPWQLQVILLVLVTIGIRQLWKINTNPESIEEEYTPQNIAPKSSFFSFKRGKFKSGESERQEVTPATVTETDGKITRKYRGVSYEVQVSTSSQTSEEIGGTYRGNPWTSKTNPVISEAPSYKSQLTYRGVRWNVKTSEKSKKQDESP